MFRAIAAILVSAAIACGAGMAGESRELPNPLENAKAGQWVQVRMQTMFGPMEQKQTVLGVQGEGDERVVTLKAEYIDDGEVVDSKEDSISINMAREEQNEVLRNAAEVEYTDVKVDLKGESVDATRVTFTQEGERYTLYLCDRVPVVGMIRLEVEGMEEPGLMVVDFGE